MFCARDHQSRQRQHRNFAARHTHPALMREQLLMPVGPELCDAEDQDYEEEGHEQVDQRYWLHGLRRRTVARPRTAGFAGLKASTTYSSDSPTPRLIDSSTLPTHRLFRLIDSSDSSTLPTDSPTPPRAIPIFSSSATRSISRSSREIASPMRRAFVRY